MDLETIRKHIDSADADDDMRAGLADRAMECLEARGDELTTWERYHLGIALDILCSGPLAVAWTHVDSACALRDPNIGDKGFKDADSIPTKRERGQR